MQMKTMRDAAAAKSDLLTGNGPVLPFLRELRISPPTTPAELDAFNSQMNEIFGLRDKERRNAAEGTNFCPIRYLMVLEQFGLPMKSMSDFTAAFPIQPELALPLKQALEGA